MNKKAVSANPNVEVFNRDVEAHGGYVYTTSTGLGHRLASERGLKAILGTGLLRDRTVLDMGCGDGFSTVRLFAHGAPRSMIGADAATQAVLAAKARPDGRAINFAAADAHGMPFPDNSFEVVLLQGVLHHDDDPAAMIREAFRLAPNVIILEPNGYNPGMKLIEKLSRYHREHNEKSYTVRQLEKWIRSAGATVSQRSYVGLVPMFCPDIVAKGLKFIEPLIEGLPFVSTIGCGVVVLVAGRAR